MSNILNRDFLIEVAEGNVDGHSIVKKFGSNSGVSTTLEPITTSSTYQTPTTAQALEILSSDTNDASTGTGARSVFIEGVNNLGIFQSETATMNGTTAVALVNNYLRVFRMYVVDSGTYADATSSSHAGTITLRGSGGGVIWGVVSVISGFGLSQSQIGVYTVPTGFTAYLLSASYSIDSNKTVDLYLFQRSGILDVIAPYSPMRLQSLQEGVTGVFQNRNSLAGVYNENTDLGFMGVVSSGTASVSVEFEMLLIEN